MSKSRARPRWQPLSELFYLGGLIDEQIDVAENQLAALREARPKPHVLNDSIMARIETLFTETLDFIEIYTEQCARWRSEPTLNDKQQVEVTRLETVLPRWRATVDEILALHDEMKGHTIEKTLAKGDFELGLEAIRRMGGEPADEHVAIARRIDRGVTGLLEEGGEAAVLSHMLDYMDDFKRLMDEAGEPGLLLLAARFEGLVRFASLLEHMAGAIRDGTLEVPKAH